MAGQHVQEERGHLAPPVSLSASGTKRKGYGQLCNKNHSYFCLEVTFFLLSLTSGWHRTASSRGTTCVLNLLLNKSCKYLNDLFENLRCHLLISHKYGTSESTYRQMCCINKVRCPPNIFKWKSLNYQRAAGGLACAVSIEVTPSRAVLGFVCFLR